MYSHVNETKPAADNGDGRQVGHSAQAHGALVLVFLLPPRWFFVRIHQHTALCATTERQPRKNKLATATATAAEIARSTINTKHNATLNSPTHSADSLSCCWPVLNTSISAPLLTSRRLNSLSALASSDSPAAILSSVSSATAVCVSPRCVQVRTSGMYASR